MSFLPDIPKFPLWFSTSPPWFPAFLLKLKNEHSPLLLLDNPRYQMIVYIIWDVISDINKKITLKCLKSIIYEAWANNYEWMKFYLRFMSKWSTTCPKLYFFCNLCHFKKIYVNNFVQSQWWIADCGFNGIRHIFIQSFGLVIHHVDYTILLWGSLGLNFTVLELKYKKLFFIAFIGREQTI